MGWTDGVGNFVSGIGDALGSVKDTIFGSGELSAEEAARKKLLEEQARKSGRFADIGQSGYGTLGIEAARVRDQLRRQASGQDSLSSEQLRQGLGQQLATQQAMAASARPGNSAMAARNAAMNMGRANYGMSGQAALAGIQERAAANQQLGQMILGQRGQELQATLGGRQQAMTGYGAGQPFQPEKGWIEKYGPAIAGGAKLFG